MKRLFFLLCLANLVFLLWQFHAGRLDSKPGQSDAPSSVLLLDEYERARRGAVISRLIDSQPGIWEQDEFQGMLADLKGEKWQMKGIAMPTAKKTAMPIETKQVAKKVESTVKPLVQAIEKTCIEVGPFSDETAIKNWLTGKIAISVQTLQKEVAIPSDYQVYFPAAKTAEQSASNKALLNAKGLQDIWSIPSGDLKGSFSLGVFKDKQRALIFKGQLAEKGIRAEIKQREKTAVQWFARVILDKAKLKQFQSSAFKPSSCAAN